MAVKNTSWSKIEPGQIVSFPYKSKNGRSIQRTVLCINPELRYIRKDGKAVKFFIGIQLKAAGQRPPTPTQLMNVIKRLGGIENEQGVIGAELPENIGKVETEKLVERLKQFKEFYRTYDLQQCRKRRVLIELDYYKLPKREVQKLESEVEINED